MEDFPINAPSAARTTMVEESEGPPMGRDAMAHESGPPAQLRNGPTRDFEIPSDAAAARHVQDEIEDALKNHQFSAHEIFSIKLALEEALVNAIKHGNQMDRGKRVRVAYRVTTERFDVWVSDQGPGFDPGELPDCTSPEHLERPCGRGVMLMRHYMTEVDYNESGNAVYMAKLRQ
jgi:serine/threonine-protein kinase RsbW